jgi:phospholipase D1/2
VSLSRRAFWKPGLAASWEELWDASQYFDRAAELLEDARSWVLIVGWQLDSRLLLLRPERPGRSRSPESPEWETLRDKVLRLCEERPRLRFYLLLWGHPSFYVPQREWLQTRVWEELHPRVHLVFDNRHPFGASHHEKFVEVDGRVLLTGSVDLCADRWDSTAHAPHDIRRSLKRLTDDYGPYHELGVQVTGPVCRLVHQHLRRRWRRLSTIPFPEWSGPPFGSDARHEPGTSGRRVWISRTSSAIDAGEAHHPITREVEFLFAELIRGARHDIWLEGQYFWSRHVHDHLIARIHSATERLRITIILADLSHLKFLPARMAWYQAHLLANLERAANSKPGIVELRVFRPSADGHPIYVHSKLVLIDDRWLSIGSANFSGRALRMDSEIMLTLEAVHSSDFSRIRRFRRELEAHWKQVVLSRVDSVTEEKLISRRSPILSRFAWQRLVDPELPYFHRWKRRLFARLERRAARAATKAVLVSLSWAVGFAPLGMLLAKRASEYGASAWILAGLLFSVWILPVPFLALAIVAGLKFDSELAAQIVILALWMAALLTQLWGRSFPTILRHWTDRFSPRPIIAFGRRRFADLVRAWADPRFTIHDKLLWQSRYWVPFSWVLLVNGLILGSTLAWMVRWVSELLAP